MSDILDSLQTVAANVETKYELAKEDIENILKKGWQQVEERIEALRELEAVKEEMDNKWKEYDER
tara:strand:+ start:484 stop:678 length:195 start_codon:yes stop_codon:yes gene_type:complete